MTVALDSLYRRSNAKSAVLLSASCHCCGLIVFPQQDRCPRCLDVQMHEKELGPDGTLVAFTGVHHPTPGSKVEPPYAIGLVEFEGGVRVAGLMTVREIYGLSVGQRVTVVAAPVFEEDGVDQLTFRFQP